MKRSGKLCRLLAWIDGAQTTGSRVFILLLVSVMLVFAMAAGSWMGSELGEAVVAALPRPLDTASINDAMIMIVVGVIVVTTLCSGLLWPNGRPLIPGVYGPGQRPRDEAINASVSDALLALYVDVAESAILAGVADVHEKKVMRDACDALVAAGLIDGGPVFEAASQSEDNRA